MRDDEGKARRFAKQLRRQLTDAETILWSRLRSWQGVKFRRQHPIGIYIADFACVAAHLVIEVDGATHSTDVEVAHDMARTAYMNARGWRVVRVTNGDIYDRLDGALEAIASLPPSTASRFPSPVNGGGKLLHVQRHQHEGAVGDGLVRQALGHKNEIARLHEVIG
jgi:very-short-patch-repair endonuclease